MSQRMPSTRSIRVARAPWRRAIRFAASWTSSSMRGRFAVDEKVGKASL